MAAASRPGLPIEEIDERFTSTEAEAVLRDQRRDGTRTRRVRPEDIDLMAARLMAETWVRRLTADWLRSPVRSVDPRREYAVSSSGGSREPAHESQPPQHHSWKRPKSSQLAFPGHQYVLRLQAPQCAAARHARQLRAHPLRERAARCAGRCRSCGPTPRGGWIEVLFKVVGEGLRALSRVAPGARLSTLGPIGRGFTPDPSAPAPC